MTSLALQESVRPVRHEDAELVAQLYERQLENPNVVRWGYMDAKRAAYLCCLDRPDRGTAFVSTEGQTFAAVVQKVATSDDAEIVGPFPDTHDLREPLLDAVEEWCRVRGLRSTTWISADDEGRRKLFEGRGYHREHQLVWMHFPMPKLARPYVRYRSNLEVVEARHRPGDYLQLYNEAFERHLGDMRLADDDFHFRMADPCCERSDFLMATIDDRPVGLIELWADYDVRRSQRTCWLTNIAVRESHRDNLEVHFALLAAGASRMSLRHATSGKSLFDAARSQLHVLYALVGGELQSAFEFWAR